MTIRQTSFVVAFAAALLAGCSGNPTRQEIGAVTGAVIGGLAGAAVTGNTAGALAGAGAGAYVGHRVGTDMDAGRR
jgi:osmotically inducible lipoprotein OsmB